MATKIIKAWVDGAVQDIEVEVIVSPEVEPTVEERVSVLESKVPTYTTVTLLTSAWEGSEAPYSQIITINGTGVNTKVDISPTATQTAEMQDEDIAFMAENDDGVITVWSINGKPEADYEVQVVLTEVDSV